MLFQYLSLMDWELDRHYEIDSDFLEDGTSLNENFFKWVWWHFAYNSESPVLDNMGSHYYNDMADSNLSNKLLKYDILQPLDIKGFNSISTDEYDTTVLLDDFVREDVSSDFWELTPVSYNLDGFLIEHLDEKLETWSLEIFKHYYKGTLWSSGESFFYGPKLQTNLRWNIFRHSDGYDFERDNDEKYRPKNYFYDKDDVMYNYDVVSNWSNEYFNLYKPPVSTAYSIKIEDDFGGEKIWADRYAYTKFYTNKHKSNWVWGSYHDDKYFYTWDDLVNIKTIFDSLWWVDYDLILFYLPLWFEYDKEKERLEKLGEPIDHLVEPGILPSAIETWKWVNWLWWRSLYWLPGLLTYWDDLLQPIRWERAPFIYAFDEPFHWQWSEDPRSGMYAADNPYILGSIKDFLDLLPLGGDWVFTEDLSNIGKEGYFTYFDLILMLEESEDWNPIQAANYMSNDLVDFEPHDQSIYESDVNMNEDYDNVSMSLLFFPFDWFWILLAILPAFLVKPLSDFLLLGLLGGGESGIINYIDISGDRDLIFSDEGWLSWHRAVHGGAKYFLLYGNIWHVESAVMHPFIKVFFKKKIVNLDYIFCELKYLNFFFKPTIWWKGQAYAYWGGFYSFLWEQWNINYWLYIQLLANLNYLKKKYLFYIIVKNFNKNFKLKVNSLLILNYINNNLVILELINYKNFLNNYSKLKIKTLPSNWFLNNLFTEVYQFFNFSSESNSNVNNIRLNNLNVIDIMMVSTINKVNKFSLTNFNLFFYLNYLNLLSNFWVNLSGNFVANPWYFSWTSSYYNWWRFFWTNSTESANIWFGVFGDDWYTERYLLRFKKLVLDRHVNTLNTLSDMGQWILFSRFLLNFITSFWGSELINFKLNYIFWQDEFNDYMKVFDWWHILVDDIWNSNNHWKPWQYDFNYFILLNPKYWLNSMKWEHYLANVWLPIWPVWICDGDFNYQINKRPLGHLHHRGLPILQSNSNYWPIDSFWAGVQSSSYLGANNDRPWFMSGSKFDLINYKSNFLVSFGNFNNFWGLWSIYGSDKSTVNNIWFKSFNYWLPDYIKLEKLLSWFNLMYSLTKEFKINLFWELDSLWINQWTQNLDFNNVSNSLAFQNNYYNFWNLGLPFNVWLMVDINSNYSSNIKIKKYLSLNNFINYKLSLNLQNLKYVYNFNSFYKHKYKDFNCKFVETLNIFLWLWSSKLNSLMFIKWYNLWFNLNHSFIFNENIWNNSDWYRWFLNLSLGAIQNDIRLWFFWWNLKTVDKRLNLYSLLVWLMLPQVTYLDFLGNSLNLLSNNYVLNYFLIGKISFLDYLKHLNNFLNLYKNFLIIDLNDALKLIKFNTFNSNLKWLVNFKLFNGSLIFNDLILNGLVYWWLIDSCVPLNNSLVSWIPLKLKIFNDKLILINDKNNKNFYIEVPRLSLQFYNSSDVFNWFKIFLNWLHLSNLGWRGWSLSLWYYNYNNLKFLLVYYNVSYYLKFYMLQSYLKSPLFFYSYPFFRSNTLNIWNFKLFKTNSKYFDILIFGNNNLEFYQWLLGVLRRWLKGSSTYLHSLSSNFKDFKGKEKQNSQLFNKLNFYNWQKLIVDKKSLKKEQNWFVFYNMKWGIEWESDWQFFLRNEIFVKISDWSWIWRTTNLELWRRWLIYNSPTGCRSFYNLQTDEASSLRVSWFNKYFKFFFSWPSGLLNYPLWSWNSFNLNLSWPFSYNYINLLFINPLFLKYNLWSNFYLKFYTIFFKNYFNNILLDDYIFNRLVVNNFITKFYIWLFNKNLYLKISMLPYSINFIGDMQVTNSKVRYSFFFKFILLFFLLYWFLVCLYIKKFYLKYL